MRHCGMEGKCVQGLGEQATAGNALFYELLEDLRINLSVEAAVKFPLAVRQWLGGQHRNQQRNHPSDRANSGRHSLSETRPTLDRATASSRHA